MFERVAPGEPLSTAEVARHLAVDEHEATRRLRAAAAAGSVRSKAFPGAGRAWWRPADGEGAPTDDALVEVEYRSTALATPFLDAFEAVPPEGETVPTDARIDATIESVVPVRDGMLQYYTARGVSPKRYLAALRTVPGVSRARLLSTDGDRVRVEVRIDGDDLTNLFEAFGGWVTGGALLDGTVRIRGTVPKATDVAEVTDTVREWVPDAELTSTRAVYTPRAVRDLVNERLSDQQRAALEAAYYGGYFAVPRDSTGEDIATALGITRQTFNHHLRLAELAVVRQLFDATERDAL